MYLSTIIQKSECNIQACEPLISCLHIEKQGMPFEECQNI